MARKGLNIYKRKDKRWEGRYIKGYKENGTICYGYCYGKTYREVKQKLEEAKLLVMQGQEKESKNHKKFSNYCDEWLSLHRVKLKESTYIKYDSMIRKHIKPFLGEYDEYTLSSLVIEQFTHLLLHQKKLSNKTVKDILLLLHEILQYANKYSQRFRFIEIQYPKMEYKEMRVLNKEEELSLVTYLLEDMNAYKFAILLSLMTGLRIGEVCALKWKHINFKEKTLKVEATMQRLKKLEQDTSQKTRIITTQPKSNQSIRVIPLTDSILKLCRQFYVSDLDAYILTGSPIHFIEPRRLQYHLAKYTKACGLQDVHFHTLRHTFATRCVEVDFEIKSLSEILGHTSVKITLERYVHSSLALKRDNMNKLSFDSYINKPSK